MKKEDKESVKESFIEVSNDPLMHFLNKNVVVSVKILAVLMIVVIWWSLLDVVIHMYRQALQALSGHFMMESLITLLGDFLAVMIGIEIFLNIVFYLKKDAVHVPLVLATALTAVARKVIVLDYMTSSPQLIYSTAAVIAAVGVTFWLVSKKSEAVSRI